MRQVMSDNDPVAIPPDKKNGPKVVYEEQSLRIAPIPSPEDLYKYEKVLPGLPERIMQMSEREQAARHKHELLFLRTIRLGAWFSFALPVIGLAITVFLLYKEYTWTPFVIFPTSIIPSIISFWRRSWK